MMKQYKLSSTMRTAMLTPPLPAAATTAATATTYVRPVVTVTIAKE